MVTLKNLHSLLLTGADVIKPVYEGLTLIGPYALGVVAALCLFYGIFLAVKYAQCQTLEERMNAQKTLLNFVIGVAVIVVLIVVLYAIRIPLAHYIDT